jgi:uncharacterized membrane protein YphA (DoxX/SURF4 family)
MRQHYTGCHLSTDSSFNVGMQRRLVPAYWALRIGVGLGPVIAGADKFFNYLTDWSMYLSPLATRVIPLSSTVFMRAVGVVEIIVGLIVLAGFTRIGGYLVMAWLIAIAINLVTTGAYYDLAVRDIEVAIGAFTLARLTEPRKGKRV